MKKFFLFLLSLVSPLGMLTVVGSNSSQNIIGSLAKNSPTKYQRGLGGSESCAAYKVGDLAQGGVVIWVTEDGQHGLVAALTDAAVNGDYELAWGPIVPTTNATKNDPLPSTYTNPDPKKNYSGYQNQNTIEQIVNWSDNYPAFKAAADYTYTQDGITYDDWFLPCSSELSLMYALREDGDRGIIPYMVTKDYWSSREFGPNSAWYLIFTDGTQYYVTKDVAYFVRCVRAF